MRTDGSKRMQMVLGPCPGPVADEDLPSAYPWPPGRLWLRAMMVMTLDGATVGPDGRSRSISSVGDRRVFNAVRRFSDVVLIGAGTFRAERYRPMRSTDQTARARAEQGLQRAPQVAVVSGSLDLPWEEPIFADSDLRPLVVTSEAADPERLARARDHAELLVLPGPEVDVSRLLAELDRRGQHRIVCEGGAVLLASFARLNRLDEIDLALSPLMPGGGQVATGSPMASPEPMTLGHVIADTDGFLFTRYVAR
jgi:5-amino-6-(5-phosphoribosylamino)uracil reductase